MSETTSAVGGKELPAGVPAMRKVTLEQAAAELGCSRRTVERRIQQGELRGERRGKGWLVELPGLLPDESDSLRAECALLRAEVGQLRSDVTQLRASLALTEAERDQAKALLEAVTSDRDYLRQAHAASLTLSTRLLPERTESNRPWWRLWRRE